MKATRPSPNRLISCDMRRDCVALYSVKNNTDRPAKRESTRDNILSIFVSLCTLVCSGEQFAEARLLILHEAHTRSQRHEFFFKTTELVVVTSSQREI